MGICIFFFCCCYNFIHAFIFGCAGSPSSREPAGEQKEPARTWEDTSPEQEDTYWRGREDVVLEQDTYWQELSCERKVWFPHPKFPRLDTSGREFDFTEIFIPWYLERLQGRTPQLRCGCDHKGAVAPV